MKLLLALSLAVLSSLSFAEPTKRLWFVFLVNGDGPRPKEREELQKMQKAHIGNFERRFKEGKLIAAGPLGDPTGFRRGIVVLTVPSMADVQRAFEGDPFVENRIMSVQAFPWTAARETIHTDLPDPNKIGENRLILFEATRTGSPDGWLLRRQENYLKAVTARGVLAVGGSFDVTPGYAGVALVRGADPNRALEILQRSPMVAEGWAKVSAMPLWIADGALG